MGDLIVQAKGLCKIYPLGEKMVHALRGISFEIKRGEFVAIVGSSGSGKTTALNLIGGLDFPTSGDLVVDGQKTSLMNDDALSDFRAKKLGFIFQTFNLIPVLTAKENVEYPLLHFKHSKEELDAMAMKALQLVGLEAVADHRPSQMSGGQRQRVAIARALVHKPQLVIADEPTANLDRKTAIEIMKNMRTLNRELGVTFIFSTHDPIVYEEADRIIKIVDGEVVL